MIFGKKPPQNLGDLEGIEVWSPPDAGPWYVMLLGDILGIGLHWNEHRTVPCEGERRCKYCKAKLLSRWTGYIPSLARLRNRNRQEEATWKWYKVVFGIGTIAAAELSGKQLRGMGLKTFRHKADRGAIIVQPWEGSVALTGFAALPAAFDVRPILQRLWGINHWPIQEEPVEQEGANIIPFSRRRA